MFESPLSLELTVDGVRIAVRRGTTVAAAVLMVKTATRASISGEPRAPFCGVGICLECCVSINGVPHQRSCQIICRPDMDVLTATGSQ